MHHFLFVLWILFDAETDHAIERRMYKDDCILSVQSLQDLMFARFEEPQETFWFFFYACDFFVCCLFTCHIKYLHTSMVLSECFHRYRQVFEHYVLHSLGDVSMLELRVLACP